MTEGIRMSRKGEEDSKENSTEKDHDVGEEESWREGEGERRGIVGYHNKIQAFPRSTLAPNRLQVHEIVRNKLETCG